MDANKIDEKCTVAYFCMEYAIDQSLKIYSGGLGFLAGSYLRSAYELNKNMVAIGILYTYGYYDQVPDEYGRLSVFFRRREYPFLEDTGLLFTITIKNSPVHVKVYLLPSSTFGTAPLYLLSTDIPENDFLSRTISHHLYNSNLETKIAQSILLGIGGAKLLNVLNIQPEIYHLNEGHGLPLVFDLYDKFKSVEEVRKHVVFTTHTPERAGNDKVSIDLLHDMGFFGSLLIDEVKRLTHAEDNNLDYTLTALRFSKKANGVSEIHGDVARKMWANYDNVCPIISITNAQNYNYWTDSYLKTHLCNASDEALSIRKRELKLELFAEVADQTGKLFDLDVLTIVWARRVTGYKRMTLLLEEWELFMQLVNHTEQPIQVIWAGKPYPEDYESIALFNALIEKIRHIKGCAVLLSYELGLSGLLKKGADVWLNTPHYGREASGTSGMSAAMNGAVNFSIADGWFPEFSKPGQNSFLVQPSFASTTQQQDKEDAHLLYKILSEEIIPVYYNDKPRWLSIIKNGMLDIVPNFDTGRMINQYYDELYEL